MHETRISRSVEILTSPDQQPHAGCPVAQWSPQAIICEPPTHRMLFMRDTPLLYFLPGDIADHHVGYLERTSFRLRLS